MLVNFIPEQIRPAAERAAPLNFIALKSQMLHHFLISHWNLVKIAACSGASLQRKLHEHVLKLQIYSVEVLFQVAGGAPLVL